MQRYMALALLGWFLSISGMALADGAWPRMVPNADGSQTVIPAAPLRILSTSVTITGTLLAVDAPLVASATSANGLFFTQWGAVAKARGVEPLWPAGSVDLEAAYAMAPDLIIVSATGADSALPQLAALRDIAPTLILDYGGQTWQSLAVQIGTATGLEAGVAARLAAFDADVAAARARITPPAGLVNVISYNGPGAPNPIATRGGVHGQLLTALGFTVEDPPRDWQSAGNPAHDFIRAEYERLTQLTAATTFLLAAADDRAAAFLADPLLGNLPSVQTGQVYGLGENSFRIDFYSATGIVDAMLRRFGPD